MIRNIIRNIGYMVVLTVLGAANMIIAPLTPTTTLFIINVVSGIISFFIAWISFRRAIKEAIEFDSKLLSIGGSLISVNYILNKLLSILKGEDSTAPSDDPKNIGHPV